jgi:methylenetetrahydrofolate--tRNA-(uracil-5-)-methyltransferase
MKSRGMRRTSQYVTMPKDERNAADAVHAQAGIRVFQQPANHSHLFVHYSSAVIYIIGAGLAGCEAAWQAARRGCPIVLFEMKPQRFSPAHVSPHLAELVCSNSFKSDSRENASGVLKEEMRSLHSLILEAATAHRVPAGSALAVDRNEFSRYVTEALSKEKNITLVRQEITEIPDQGVVIIATGPLTSEAFSAHLRETIGHDFLYFHDAISPIIETDTIDLSRAFRASRYNKGDADYINCPLSQAEYYGFLQELLKADKVALRDFETLIPYEGCMPVEVMAARGIETLAFGPMKPVGLIDPRTGKQPYAVVQLRQENEQGTLYNMVGFQTRLKWPEQKRVFSLIPGLLNAEFARYGSLHRNTYIHSPSLLLKTLQLKNNPRIFFAGQITGVEGYIESAAMGLVAGIQASRFIKGKNPLTPSQTTMIGALLSYITGPFSVNFQPMNANFGILPLFEPSVRKRDRKKVYADRALSAITEWKNHLEI